MCYLGATLEEPAVIRHRAAGGLIVGSLQKKKDPRLEAVVKMFSEAKIQCTESMDIFADQWKKLVWNVGFNGPCALINASVGELLKREEQRILIRSLMTETICVAKASGQGLEESLAEKTMKTSEKEHAEILPSMVWDRRRSKPLEWDIFYGFIVKEGKRLGLSTPANKLVAGLLEAISSH
jgi:2-dehydropantoate 2-reductase